MIIDGAIVVVGLGALIGLVAGQAHHSGGSFSLRLHGNWAWLWYALAFGYWIVLERLWGTTVGKRIFGLRVTSRDGTPLTWGQSFGRNLMRLIDGIPFVIPYLVGFIVAATDDEKARLGDRVAHTTVVSDAKPT